MSFRLSFFPFFVSLIVLAGLLLAAAPALANVGAPADAKTIDAYLRGQVSANHLPGLAVAMVQDGKIIFSQGYGQVTAQTPFYLGSVSKTFTALAVMQLVEQGKLELDAPVQRYIPWFRVADEAASAQITVRHLLNHTSGLGEDGDPRSSEYSSNLEEQVRAMRSARLTAPVGTKYQYNSQNYRVLGLLIEKASGQSYAEYIQAHIFAPLEMTRSAADPQSAPGLAQANGTAFGFPLPRSQAFRPAALPSGYLISTAEDMTHYMIAILDSGAYAGKALVRPETLAAMQTPPAGIESQYGFGWMSFSDPQFGRVIFHNGALENYNAELILLPDRRTGIVALINQGGLYRQLTANLTVTSGLADLLNGQQPQAVSYAWIGYVLLALAALDLLNHARLFAGLRRWARKTALLPRRKQWLRALPGLVLPALLLVSLPTAAYLAGGPGKMLEIYNLLPDVLTWLLVGLALDVLRGLLRVWNVARMPAARRRF